jgi:hypothetical protein
MRFFHGWKPKESRDQVLHGMRLVLDRSDIADLVIDDLRQWEEWEMTPTVLGLYGKKGYDTATMRRAIARFALCCPRPEAKHLVDDLKEKDPKLIASVQEFLEFEKKPIK